MILESHLRYMINDYVRNLFIKEACENCGKKDNLHLHHIKLFSEILNDTLLELGLEYKDTEEYAKIELDNIDNVVLGKHLRMNYVTLCNVCHMKIHRGSRPKITNNVKYKTTNKKFAHDNDIKNHEKEKYQKAYLNKVLLPYIHTILDDKLFIEDQEKLADHLRHVISDFDYRTKKVKHSTIEKLFIKHDLPFVVSKSKAETKGLMRNKKYIVISKLS